MRALAVQHASAPASETDAPGAGPQEGSAPMDSGNPSPDRLPTHDPAASSMPWIPIPSSADVPGAHADRAAARPGRRPAAHRHLLPVGPGPCPHGRGDLESAHPSRAGRGRRGVRARPAGGVAQPTQCAWTAHISRQCRIIPQSPWPGMPPEGVQAMSDQTPPQPGWGPPPAPEKQPQKKRSGAFKAGFLGCFGVLAAVVVVIIVVAVIASSGSKTNTPTPNASESESVTTRPPPSPSRSGG